VAWIFLIIAGFLEVAWALGMKKSEGFSKLWPSIATIAGMILSFYFLGKALNKIPIGTAYAVWTAIGAVGVAIWGMVFFGESAAWPRLLCLGLIVLGIFGLKLTSH
jgi:quaternary ammonium compound-resistance protein SugE